MIRTIIQTYEKAHSRVLSAFDRSVDPSPGQVRAVALSVMLAVSIVAVGGATVSAQTGNATNYVYSATGTDEAYQSNVSTGDSFAIDGSDAGGFDSGADIAYGDGYVYLSYESTVSKIARDGTEDWQISISVSDLEYGSNDYLYVTTGNAVEKVDQSGSTVDTLSMSSVVDVQSAPNGEIYVVNGSEIRRYDDTLSVVDTRSVSYTPDDLDYDSGEVFVTGDDGQTIRGYSADLSSEVFSASQPGVDVTSEVAVGPDHVYQANRGNFDTTQYYVYDRSTGSELVNKQGTENVPSSPQDIEYYDGNLYIVSNSGPGKYNETLATLWTASPSANDFRGLAVPGDESATPPQQTATPGAEEPQLELDADRYMEHGSTQNYSVIYTNDQGDRSDVTDSATVVSNNTTVVTVDEPNSKLIATSDTSINGTAEITASYSGETVTKTVTVANATLDNAEILPGTWRATAMISDDTIFFLIIVAMIMGVIGRYSTAFAGLGIGQLAVAIGWWGGYVPEGIAMVSIFLALFIGFNLAANIDYTVRA